MSDALELLPEDTVNPPKACDEVFPKHIGNFRQCFPKASTTVEIINKFNRHAAHVLEGSKTPHKMQPLTFPPFFSLQNKPDMAIDDAPLPDNFEWMQSIKHVLRPDNHEKCSLRQNEAVEAIKHIRKQTAGNTTEEGASDELAVELGKKIYETLKFFYSYFPVKDSSCLVEMRKILELVRTLFNEMRGKVRHSETLGRADAMIQAANSRFNYLSNMH